MVAMARALKVAGYQPAADRIAAAADKAIRENPRDWDAAWRAFREAVWADPEMTREAFKRYEEAALRPYIHAAAQQLHRAGKPRAVSGGGRCISDNRVMGAPTRSGQDAAIAAARRTLLDTFLINGQPLGDVSAAVARSWGQARSREARFIGIITAGIAATDHRPIREMVTAEEADQAFKRAGEIGNE